MKQFDSLAAQKSWTVLLRALPEDTPTKVTFPDADAIKSCRSMAYQPYGDLRNWSFSFKSTDNLQVIITKKRV